MNKFAALSVILLSGLQACAIPQRASPPAPIIDGARTDAGTRRVPRVPVPIAPPPPATAEREEIRPTQVFAYTPPMAEPPPAVPTPPPVTKAPAPVSPVSPPTPPAVTPPTAPAPPVVASPVPLPAAESPSAPPASAPPPVNQSTANSPISQPVTPPITPRSPPPTLPPPLSSPPPAALAHSSPPPPVTLPHLAVPKLPPAINALSQQAEQQRLNGDHAGAAATLERALRLQPQEAYLWNRLARVRLEQGMSAQANTLAARSNSFAGDQAQLKRNNWLMIATARRQSGDEAGATEAERKANGG